jgi:hypothetical protein
LCIEAGAIPDPGFFQILEIVERDFICWRIARMGRITAEITPLAILGSWRGLYACS